MLFMKQALAIFPFTHMNFVTLRVGHAIYQTLCSTLHQQGSQFGVV